MDCVVYKKKQQNNAEEEWGESEELFVDPIDSNDVQTFSADIDAEALRIEFGRSKDFHGRIVIYSLEVWGKEVRIDFKILQNIQSTQFDGWSLSSWLREKIAEK